MNLAQRLELWGDRHHPKWLDLIRISLGLFLIYKAIEFLNNMTDLMNTMSNALSSDTFALVIVSHYIVFAHLLGGILLVLGLLTRFACIIQIPILLGAIVLLNYSGGWLQPFSELWLSILILMLLVLFLVVGNGPWSFEWFVKRDDRMHGRSSQP